MRMGLSSASCSVQRNCCEHTTALILAPQVWAALQNAHTWTEVQNLNTHKTEPAPHRVKSITELTESLHGQVLEISQLWIESLWPRPERACMCLCTSAPHLGVLMLGH